MECYVCHQDVVRLTLVDDAMCCAECAKARRLAKLDPPVNPDPDAP